MTETNMYDCLPCPNCDGKFCAPYPDSNDNGRHYVICDDCGEQYEAAFSESSQMWLRVDKPKGDTP